MKLEDKRRDMFFKILNLIQIFEKIIANRYNFNIKKIYLKKLILILKIIIMIRIDSYVRINYHYLNKKFKINTHSR